jgi:glyoxylase-like metal-dependent hydrolase (beta-lactamase superfamily II)
MQQFPDLGTEVPEITAAELKARVDAGEQVTVLDTRRPAEFEAWKLSDPNVRSVNVPFTEFLDDGEPVEAVPEGVPDGQLVVSCAKGISSGFVAEFLAREGREVEALADGMEGWARLYEATELDVDGPTVLQYHRPSSGCLGYMIVSGGEAAVIDPLRAFADRYVADARERGAELVYALDTHVHADHVSGVREVADLADAEAVVPSGATGRGLAFDAALVEDGDAIEVGEARIEAVGLPGHTTEMTGYRAGEVLVTGDTLFLESVARPDLEDGAEGAPDAARTLFDTLQAVFERPDGTVVAPGHTSGGEEPAEDGTYTRRLAELRESLSLPSDRETFVDRILADMPPRPANFGTIIATNLGRERLTDDDAFEAELGPNNCAASAD